MRPAAAALATLLATSSAAAQTNLAETYFNNGNRAFAAQRYDEAARAFREAHAISHRPELLFNLSRALERSGDYVGAVQALHLKPRPLARPRGPITAEIWYAPALQHLPVRIRITQGADTFMDLLVETIEQR